MDFALSEQQTRLQKRCLELAADFATRSAEHDRDASHPIENYDRLRQEGFLALTVPTAMGGGGASFLDHTIAYEALGQGCPSTALAFNMHSSVVMPILECPDVSAATKRSIADLVVHERRLIGGNFSEPGTTSLIGERGLAARARRIDGGYSITGRKMFASMLEAADYVIVLAYPEDAIAPFAGALLLVPPDVPGRSVNANWNTLGMRATRSDSPDPERLPGAGRCVAFANRRYAGIPPRLSELVLGFIYSGISWRCGGGLRRAPPHDAVEAAARRCPVSRLSPRRTPPYR